jgi:DNA-binding MarR family transcriptional regulator
MKKSNAAKKQEATPLNVMASQKEDPTMPPEPENKLIHERKRLAILSALAVNTSLSFKELKGLLELSDGNLSVHAQKLEGANYINCTKAFEGRTPKTTYTITPTGKKALSDYLDHMEKLIAMVRDKG